MTYRYPEPYRDGRTVIFCTIIMHICMHCFMMLDDGGGGYIVLRGFIRTTCEFMRYYMVDVVRSWFTCFHVASLLV